MREQISPCPRGPFPRTQGLAGRSIGPRPARNAPVRPALYRRPVPRHIEPAKASKGRHMVPAVGAKAPAFTLPRDGGGTLSLADFKGRKLVLYFYPTADTPGCTKESIAFSGLTKGFATADTDGVGASADPVKWQDKFRNKHKVARTLASEETKKMRTAYGVW